MSYKKWILIATLLFGASLALGLITPPDIITIFAEELGYLPGNNGEDKLPFDTSNAIGIFSQNAMVLLVSFTLSPILCLVPILSLILNGWFIAFISLLVIQEEILLLSGNKEHQIK